MVIGKHVSMRLCERPFKRDDVTIREIRKLSENGHQTSIVATLRTESIDLLVGKMFSRRSQEKTARSRAKLYAKTEVDLEGPIDVLKEHLHQQTRLQGNLADFEIQLQQLREKKLKTPITVTDMPADTKYNRLKTENKMLIKRSV